MTIIIQTLTLSNSIKANYKNTQSIDLLIKTDKDINAVYNLYAHILYQETLSNTDLPIEIMQFSITEVGSYTTALCNSSDSLKNYANYVALYTIHELITKDDAKAFTAHNLQTNELVGFISFYPAKIEDKKVIYISQLGVKYLRQGIGKILTQQVLNNYPHNTKFVVLARNFNTNAIALYISKDIGFTEQSSDICKSFGYDPKNYLALSKN